jgi:DNA (cytosine-5)-methyltransferase 1
MKAIDLFCGCGGFSLGAHAAGFDVKAAFDIDPILTSSFTKNFPKTKLFLRDVAKLSGAEVRAAAGGDVDLIFGGPPCQGFSSIGKRDVKDERRTLLGHFFRVVAETRPAAFLMENVRGLGFKDAQGVLDAGLAQVPKNYVVSKPMILDAGDFGAATKRQRLFVLGYDPHRCAPIRAEDFLVARSPASTVADAITDLAGATFLRDEDEFDLWQRPDVSDASPYARKLHATDGRFTGHRKTDHTKKVLARFSAVAQGSMDKVGRHPRLSWSGQCPTLRAGTGTDMGSYQSVRPIHPSEHRVITVREAARLQGFPDAHLFHPTVWHSFRMIGNSVSPIISRAILSVVADAISSIARSKAA